MDPLRLAVMAAVYMNNDGWFQIPCAGFVVDFDLAARSIEINPLPGGSYPRPINFPPTVSS